MRNTRTRWTQFLRARCDQAAAFELGGCGYVAGVVRVISTSGNAGAYSLLKVRLPLIRVDPAGRLWKAHIKLRHDLKFSCGSSSLLR